MFSMFSAYCGFTAAISSFTDCSAMNTPVTPPTMLMVVASSRRFSKSSSVRGIW
jgi:hypothetical protein